MKQLYCTVPSKCPTAVIGGSYPGSLSSWFKLLYPHLADASWASSAPVEIRYNFSEYDDHCANVLASISPQCLSTTQETFADIEELIKNEKEATMLRFGVNSSLINDDVTFMYMLADVLATPVQYQSAYSVLPSMCKSIVGKEMNDRIDILADTIKEILKITDDSIYSSDLYLLTNVSLEDENKDARAWTWMTCNQVGWYQTASGRLRSTSINLAYFNNLCQTLFNVDIGEGNDMQMNMRYGGKSAQGYSTIFVNGQSDPWSRMSISDQDEKLSRFTYTVENGHHCDDLHSQNSSDSASLANIREDVLAKLSRWLSNDDKGFCGKHGKRVLNSCICDDTHSGDYCEEDIHPQNSFRVITIASVVVPTFLLLIIGGIVWVCGKKEDSDFGARPALYT